MDRDELKRLQKLADAATPGPWRTCGSEECGDPNCTGIYYGDSGVGVLYADGDERQARRNAEFIAAARSAVPKLGAEVERLQAERDKLRERLEAASAGQPLGPVIGAQQILELATENKQLRAVLEGYEQWEADLIMDDSVWNTPSGLPFPQALYDRLIELQEQRNTALGRDQKPAVRRALEGNDQ